MDTVAAELTNTTASFVDNVLPSWIVESAPFMLFLNSVVMSVVMSLLAVVGSAAYFVALTLKARLCIFVEVHDNSDVYDWIEHALQTSQDFQSTTVTHATIQTDEAKIRERARQQCDIKTQNHSPTPLLWKPLEGTRYCVICRNRRVWITKEKIAAAGYYALSMYKFKIECFGFNKNFVRDVVLSDFEKQYHKSHKRSRWVEFYRLSVSNDSSSRWSHVTTKPVRSIHSVITADNQVHTIVKDMQQFLANEDWYVTRGIPYRRGYLFYGPPGTGKSSLAQAIAGELSLVVYMINLGTAKLTDEILTEKLSAISNKGIILLEDIDAAFGSTSESDVADARVATAEVSKGITFSGLLNALDGVAAQEGKLLIMTTNHIERLDPALIRPGRVDMRYHLDLATRDMMKRLFMSFYSGAVCPDGNKDANENAKIGSKDKKIVADAETFAAAVPENTYAISELQGHLMLYKTDPHEAIRALPEFLAAK